MRESFKKAVDFLGQDEGVPADMRGAFHDMAGRAATYHEMGGRTLAASAHSHFMGVNGSEAKHTIVSVRAGTEPQTEEHHIYRNNTGGFVHAIRHGSEVPVSGKVSKGRTKEDMMDYLHSSHTLD